MADPVNMIDRLEEIAEPYKVILSDVWGVVHNGVSAFPEAVDALARMRAAGKKVILITNAPRPHPLVIEQMERLGVRDDAWDKVGHLRRRDPQADRGRPTPHLPSWAGARHVAL